MTIMGYKKSESPKTKKAKKPKQKTLGQLHKTLVELCQKLARLSYADESGYVLCFTCAGGGHYKKMQGGHMIPKAIYPTRYEKDNIRPQCCRCNIHLGGNVIKFRQHLVEEIGIERVERLECQTEITEGWNDMNSCERREWLSQRIVEVDREVRILEKGLI